MLCLTLFLKFWKPREIWRTTALKGHAQDSDPANNAPSQFGRGQFERHAKGLIVRAWVPWLILTLFVFLWGMPTIKNVLNGQSVQVSTVDGIRTEVKTTYPWMGFTKFDLPWQV